MNVRNVVLHSIAALAVLAGAFVVGMMCRGTSPSEMIEIGKTLMNREMRKQTVEERVTDILARRPAICELVDKTEGELSVAVFKNERKVEVSAKGWTEPKIYRMTGFSGELGPKLKEGDGQIPKGV